MFYKESQNRMKPEKDVPCANKIVHIIQPGDTLFSLANRHHTTVNRLMVLNPGVDPYNLMIGSRLIICPDELPATPVPPIGTLPPVTPIPPIGTPPPVMPPITPELPIAPIPPVCLPINAIQELIMIILHWIRENFGEREARKIMESMNSAMWKY